MKKSFSCIFAKKMMSALEIATSALPKMSRDEIAQLVQRAAFKIAGEFPGIEKNAGVCGGSACVIRTRIPVWSIVEYKNMGVSDEKLLINFPSLRKQDLSNALAYYYANKNEIDQEIAENNED